MLPLIAILILLVVLPFAVSGVEERLELFFLGMGLVAVTALGLWSRDLLGAALREPLPITLAVLGAGFVFRSLRPRLGAWLAWVRAGFGLRALLFSLVLGLGLLSGLVTSIIAALLLSEIVVLLNLPRKQSVRLVVLACFAIGLGAALTPLGGPLSAIAIANLRGEPYHAEFFFLFGRLAAWIFPLLLALSFGAAFLGSAMGGGGFTETERRESAGDIAFRAVKVYFFVMGLVFLGEGFRPLAERYLAGAPAWAIYWLNSLSAVLDNAALAAAEIVPALSPAGMRSALLGLLIAGGMLVPGNIPNIICASKLKITSKEWAAFGLPLGLALMAVVFAALNF